MDFIKIFKQERTTMSQTTLYIECTSGISGDMAVAALIDLGADQKKLIQALDSLPMSGYTVEIKDVLKSGIRACDFNVILQQDNHDHDMNYLHGNQPVHNSKNQHTHSSENLHSHEHQSQKEHAHHDARNLNDIIEIICAGDLTDNARELALQIFRILAEAEASVHGKNIDEVHFHEVGAVDSIVDIVAFAVCLDNLAPDCIVVSALTDGSGQIRCQHGLIPVPVPAVTAIASRHQLSLKFSSVEGELVTPTGAAIAAALKSDEKLPTQFRIKKTGFGAGKRDYATAGFLRAMLLESLDADTQDTILTLETNIDDCSAEALSFTMKQLLEAGALDVFFIPIYMKKNRPGQLLKVICLPENRKTMESIIFRNTTTIGIRCQELQRTKLDRRILAVETPWGMADIKCCTYENDTYYYPENDSVCHLAQQFGIGFTEMYGQLQNYVREHTTL
jgi:uncharacterized protein (TIGR00299 family) protein